MSSPWPRRFGFVVSGFKGLVQQSLLKERVLGIQGVLQRALRELKLFFQQALQIVTERYWAPTVRPVHAHLNTE